MNEEATKGYAVKRYPKPTRRIVQTLALRDNDVLIKEYRRLHSQGVIWKEILEGIRSVGILEMEIYIKGCTLVMILEVDSEFNWEESMNKLAALPRQAEWEAVVAKFQQATPSQKSSEKWMPMERMFYLYD